MPPSVQVKLPRCNWRLFLVLLFAASSSLAHGVELSGCNKCTVQPPTAYWGEQLSANFVVHFPNRHATQAAAAAETCEALRQQLADYWTDDAVSLPNWQQRCHVVLHATAAGYVRAVGEGAQNTSGCATLKRLKGQVISRRIDLRLDRPDPLARVLPHELTHVLLADLCAVETLPRWADEGTALLADTAEKQTGHLRDFHAARQAGTARRATALLALADYPPASEQAAFYGQSLALVQLLVEKKSPAQFLRFLEAGEENGYPAALSDHYGLGEVATLERHLRLAPSRTLTPAILLVKLPAVD